MEGLPSKLEKAIEVVCAPEVVYYQIGLFVAVVAVVALIVLWLYKGK